ncbi:MAG: hypothetical protein JWO78_1964 [Micavibrio sp.]|nr:hypothetical protein [Micavibrio sp.]
MANNESNNTLYFIVGGLVVLAVIFGFAMWGPYDMTGSSQSSIQPAAGGYSASSSGTRTDQTKVESQNDGSGSVTQTTTTQSNNP